MNSKKTIPHDFNWEWYLKLNPDLITAGIFDEGGAVAHWIRWGHQEGREYRSSPNLRLESPTIDLDIPLERIYDYDAAIKDGILDIRNTEEAEVNFIIPVRCRSEFLSKTIKSVKAAADKFDRKVNITVSENSGHPEHALRASELGADYIWTRSHSPFNKCFAMNIAVFFTKKTRFLIFHDVDCLVQSDFFDRVFQNIETKGCQAIQTFSDRRVLYLNEEVTNRVLSEKIHIDSLSIAVPGIDPPYRSDGRIAYGAPGGSVCVTRELFFRIGGYDPYYFESYAPEDIFFWLKVEAFETFETCTNPRNEIYHMNHPRVEVNPLKLGSMEMIKNKFEKLRKTEKWDLLNRMRNKINRYE